MSLIRGVLLAGKFRTQHELNQMSQEDQRNTLIVELTKHSNQSNYQSFDDATLAGMGAVMVFLRIAGIRDDAGLKMMSADDQRNTLIVEMAGQTRLGVAQLQGIGNIDLVLLGLGFEDPGISLHQPAYIRGVLLAGKFRSQRELNQMSTEDLRNTLIVELTKHSNQTNYQSFDDYTLAGMGAVMVFLRETGIRNDEGLRLMGADDQRNTLIAEIGAQTGLGARLQGLRSMDLVRIALGADPEPMFRPLPPPLQPLPPKRLQFRLHNFIEYQTTDNFINGVKDEVFIQGIALDSSKTYLSPNGTIVTEQAMSPVIGDIGDDSVRGSWPQNPLVLFEFDLEHEGPMTNIPTGPGGPRIYRVFTIILLMVEEDNGDVADTMSELKDRIHNRINDFVSQGVASAVGAAAVTAEQITTPVIGGVIGGALGSIPGLVAAYYATLAFDGLFTAISEGLANEVFTPKTFKLVLVHPIDNLIPEEIDRVDWVEIREHGALYRLYYDWHIELG